MREFLSRDEKFWNPVFRRQLLQFENESTTCRVPEADLDNAAPIQTLAWVLRFITPYVSIKPGAMLSNLQQKVPLERYVTVSDLAFSVVLMEHYSCTWKAEAHFNLESGADGQNNGKKATFGQDGQLFYEGGLAGEQAKRRYASLCKYFYLNFFSDVREEAPYNLDRLQYVVDRGTEFEPERLDAETQEAFQNPPTSAHREMVSEITHRVYSMGPFSGESRPGTKK